MFNFHYKVTKLSKNMIKVYEVSRKYIILFMHNNRYLPLTGLLTLLQWTIEPALIMHRKIFEIFNKYFTKYFMKYFTPKNSWNFTSRFITLVFSSFRNYDWVIPNFVPQIPSPSRFRPNKFFFFFFFYSTNSFVAIISVS